MDVLRARSGRASGADERSVERLSTATTASGRRGRCAEEADGDRLQSNCSNEKNQVGTRSSTDSAGRSDKVCNMIAQKLVPCLVEVFLSFFQSLFNEMYSKFDQCLIEVC